MTKDILDDGGAAEVSIKAEQLAALMALPAQVSQLTRIMEEQHRLLTALVAAQAQGTHGMALSLGEDVRLEAGVPATKKLRMLPEVTQPTAQKTTNTAQDEPEPQPQRERMTIIREKSIPILASQSIHDGPSGPLQRSARSTNYKAIPIDVWQNNIFYYLTNFKDLLAWQQASRHCYALASLDGFLSLYMARYCDAGSLRRYLAYHTVQGSKAGATLEEKERMAMVMAVLRRSPLALDDRIRLIPWAIEEGLTGVVAMWLQALSPAFPVPSSYLTYAVQCGCEGIVAALLADKRVEVTPRIIFAALRGKHVRILRHIINHNHVSLASMIGSWTHEETSQLETELKFACFVTCRDGSLEDVQYLISLLHQCFRMDEEWTCIQQACRNKDSRVLGFLFELREFSVMDDDEVNILMNETMEGGHLDTMDRLLRELTPQDLSLISRDEYSYWFYSCQPNMVRFLLQDERLAASVEEAGDGGASFRGDVLSGIMRSNNREVVRTVLEDPRIPLREAKRIIDDEGTNRQMSVLGDMIMKDFVGSMCEWDDLNDD